MLSPKSRQSSGKEVAPALVCVEWGFLNWVAKEKDRLVWGSSVGKAQRPSSLGCETHDLVSGALSLEFGKWPLRKDTEHHMEWLYSADVYVSKAV